jgi:hypothetical protein
VCGERYIGHHLWVRGFAEAEFEHADRFPAVGHRREQASPLRTGFAFDRLGRKGAAVRASRQGDPFSGFTSLRASGRRATGVAEPDQCVAAEVRDQEGQLAGAESVSQAFAEDIDSSNRRSILNGREQ